ncbi:DNA polymerase beta superfamily protein [Streptomyces sp. 5-10]|uniref:nucleotidyltransferase domain-containing protein n=1 Tax=Streptomyces sp. 5-10 TaxID=878925 RepID=UPI00168A835B|nr:nucleotidyltransferase domain-containing protein [Streptomyces sp. 5-10]MBD3004740.1 nucleotidyltransferase domain-containing protein [Streptomyces sp. 5-10]
MNVLLSGVVGSRAYGLGTPESDIDRLGIFAEPTRNLLGLVSPKESHVTSKPDTTFHEARKAARLMLSGNPTVTELLWLDHHEKLSPLGGELLSIRTAFLSAQRVRDAYLGYAASQFKRLRDRSDGSFSSGTRKRTEKHARHLVRLLQQGVQLYSTGQLTVRLDDPDAVRRMGSDIAEHPVRGEELIATTGRAFDGKTVLPEQADVKTVEAWLQKVRAHYYTP